MEEVDVHGRPRAGYALALMTAINFLNYMDRYTVSAVLTQIENYYGVNDFQTGLIQTSFIFAYMIFAPIFGILGDRVNRKVIVILGITFWTFFTLTGSLIPKNRFWLFILMRGLVGIGEASYITVSYSIIGDLYTKETRLRALAIFSFAVPLGSGAGYITGQISSELASHFFVQDNSLAWKYALRVTPIFGALFIILCIFYLPNPKRGSADNQIAPASNSFRDDILALCRNTTLVLATGGFIAVDFVAGSLALWGPTFVENAGAGGIFGSSVLFGIATCLAGIFGVGLGAVFSNRLKTLNNMENADPIVCGLGMLVSAPLLFVALIVAAKVHWLFWFLVFISITCGLLNWALIPNIILDTVVPNRRSLASGVTNLIGHAFGDAISPPIVGFISEHVDARGFYNLQYGLFINVIISVIGGCCFLASSLFYSKDNQAYLNELRLGNSQEGLMDNEAEA